MGKGQFEKDGAQIGFGLESKGNLVFGSLEDGDLWLQEGQLGAGKTGAYKVCSTTVYIELLQQWFDKFTWGCIG